MSDLDLLGAVLTRAHSLSIVDVEGRVGEDTRRAGRYQIGASRRGDGMPFSGFGETPKAALAALLRDLLAAGLAPADDPD